MHSDLNAVCNPARTGGTVVLSRANVSTPDVENAGLGRHIHVLNKTSPFRERLFSVPGYSELNTTLTVTGPEGKAFKSPIVRL